MKILTSEQVRETDAYTIANEPISSTDLMERAAKACSDYIIQHFKQAKSFSIFCGPGNNGGDGLVISRLLLAKGFSVDTYLVWFMPKGSSDFEINLRRLKECNDHNILEIKTEEDAKDFSLSNSNSIIIDAILGSGLSKPTEGLVATIIEKINKIPCFSIAIDVPSGLHGEDNSVYRNHPIIKANLTLALEIPKLSLLLPENAEYTGDFAIIPIGLDQDFIEKCDSKYFLTQYSDIFPQIKKRSKFAHKGNFGHALLEAGSTKMAGAALIASKACIRSGVGLLTVHSSSENRIIQQLGIPEAMFDADENENFVTKISDYGKYSTIGIGPGIGKDPKTAAIIKVLIQEYKSRIVFDADALNILSENKTWLAFLNPGSILTPHEGEFERLVGKWKNETDKLERLTSLSLKHNIYVVLKGAHSIIACPDKTLYFNTTGNPGMACGGSGDALTGIILSFLAQGYHPKLAAIMGVYIHGLAGDMAADEKGVIAMNAGDICEGLVGVFKRIEGE